MVQAELTKATDEANEDIVEPTSDAPPRKRRK
jgi:hypothetical protein